MQNEASHPWTPVRVPRVQVAKRRVTSLGALAALGKLHEREHEIIHANILRGVAGCVVVLMSCAALPVFAEWILRESGKINPNAAKSSPDLSSLCLALDLFLLLFTVPLAIAVSALSRSRLVNQFLDSGTRSSGTNDNPLVRFLVILVTLGLLYGEFLVIDAMRFAVLRIRLRNVDRHRAALILAKLFAEPAGIDPRTLLEFGENPLYLRQTLGYLMACEWADISPQDDWITFLSSSKRELRHARNGLFEFGADQ
jgi:hypothetical protein